MGSARYIRVVFSTALLVLLGCGVVTLGFAKAGHTTARQHMAAEAGEGSTADHRSAPSVMADQGAVPAGREHVEHALHLLGACAAVLAAILAVHALQEAGKQGEAGGVLAPGQLPWSRVPAPAGLGPPARTLLCVQLH